MKTLQREPNATTGIAPITPSANFDWLMANFDRLVEEYQGKYLAIDAQRVIAAADNPRELRKALDGLGSTSPLITRAHPDAWRSVR